MIVVSDASGISNPRSIEQEELLPDLFGAPLKVNVLRAVGEA